MFVYDFFGVFISASLDSFALTASLLSCIDNHGCALLSKGFSRFVCCFICSACWRALAASDWRVWGVGEKTTAIGLVMSCKNESNRESGRSENILEKGFGFPRPLFTQTSLQNPVNGEGFCCCFHPPLFQPIPLIPPLKPTFFLSPHPCLYSTGLLNYFVWKPPTLSSPTTPDRELHHQPTFVYSTLFSTYLLQSPPLDGIQSVLCLSCNSLAEVFRLQIRNRLELVSPSSPFFSSSLPSSPSPITFSPITFLPTISLDNLLSHRLLSPPNVTSPFSSHPRQPLIL